MGQKIHELERRFFLKFSLYWQECQISMYKQIHCLPPWWCWSSSLCHVWHSFSACHWQNRQFPDCWESSICHRTPVRRMNLFRDLWWAFWHLGRARSFGRKEVDPCWFCRRGHRWLETSLALESSQKITIKAKLSINVILPFKIFFCDFSKLFFR